MGIAWLLQWKLYLDACVPVDSSHKTGTWERLWALTSPFQMWFPYSTALKFGEVYWLCLFASFGRVNASCSRVSIWVLEFFVTLWLLGTVRTICDFCSSFASPIKMITLKDSPNNAFENLFLLLMTLTSRIVWLPCIIHNRSIADYGYTYVVFSTSHATLWSRDSHFE